jgi:hypothetical protein
MSQMAQTRAAQQQQPLGLAGLQGLLGGMPSRPEVSTPMPRPPVSPPLPQRKTTSSQVVSKPAPAAVRASPAPSQVPPRTPPAVAGAIQRLAGKQAGMR